MACYLRLMATYFIKGNTYTNSATTYGLRPRDQALDSAATSMPTVKLVCVSVTPTHVTFKTSRPVGSGPTFNVGWLLGETRKYRVRRDTTGFYAEPLGRFAGMPIVRP